MKRKVWAASRPLPFKIRSSVVMVEITVRGISMWRWKKREKFFVGWPELIERIMGEKPFFAPREGGE